MVGPCQGADGQHLAMLATVAFILTFGAAVAEESPGMRGRKAF